MPLHPEKYSRFSLLFIFFFLLTLVHGQDTKAVADTTKPVIKPIPVSEITEEINIFNKSRERIDQVLKVNDNVLYIDSVFKVDNDYLAKTRDDFYQMEKIGMSRRNYEISKREWQHYLSLLSSQRKVINDRIKELQSTYDELNKTEEKWKLTEENAKNDNVSEELVSTTSQTIENIS